MRAGLRGLRGGRQQSTWWNPGSTGSPVLGGELEEPSSLLDEIEGEFPGTYSYDRSGNGVAEAALQLAYERQFVPTRDGEPEDMTRYCPPDRLRLAWQMPAGASFEHGGNILPLGPAPTVATTSVNGIVYCDGSRYAYMGFEAWWDETYQVWMVLNTPTCH